MRRRVRSLKRLRRFLLCAPTLLLVCGWLPGDSGTNAPGVLVLPTVTRPSAAQPEVGLPADRHLDKAPPRRTVGLDLVRNGWTYNCMECHKLFPAKWHYDRPMNEHKDIRLDHGNNRFCLNCHHPANRNAFVDYDGAEIAQAEVVQLCSKCHGTIYRDWKAGVHGRENGFWKAELGDKTKLRCIQCHDPHSPKFKPMQPLAPLRYPKRGANAPAKAESPSPKLENTEARTERGHLVRLGRSYTETESKSESPPRQFESKPNSGLDGRAGIGETKSETNSNPKAE
jgi:hypothetical protein